MRDDLLILRHGETVWNREGRMQGVLDSPLTARGRAQAIAMGRALAELGVSSASHRAFVSPQGRALATARLVLAPLGLEATPDPRLREIGVGDWSGLTAAEIDARWPAPDPHETFLERYARARGGEPFEALWQRVTAFLADVEGPAIIVTHGITSRFLRTAALGRGLDRLDEVPGGQGVIHRIRQGGHETIGQDGLQPAGTAARP